MRNSNSHPTAYRSPWQNPYAERVIGSIRRECLDHIIVLGSRHLKRVLTQYVDYYNGVRTHLSLRKDSPDRRPIQFSSEGRVVELKKVGGLHHQYIRKAAWDGNSTCRERLAPFSFSTLPLRFADLIEQRLQKPSAMNYGNDEDFIVLDPLDDPIAVYKVFANVLIIKLWNDASGVRERFELAGSIEDLLTTARV